MKEAITILQAKALDYFSNAETSKKETTKTLFRDKAMFLMDIIEDLKNDSKKM